MIPARFAPVVFGFILSGLMSCIVSAIATLRAVGLPPDFVRPVDVLLGLRLGRGLPHRARDRADHAQTRRAPDRRPADRLSAPHPDAPAFHVTSQRFGAASSQVCRSRASAQPGSIRPAATSRRPWLA
jgi:hypothetical protein